VVLQKRKGTERRVEMKLTGIESSFLELRTKSTIKEGIQWHEKNNDGSEIVCYCPGDGSRYVIIVNPIKGYTKRTLKKMGLSISGESLLITLASDPGSVRSFITSRRSFISYDWIMPKLGLGLASAITVAEFIAWLIDGDAWSSEEARERCSE